MAKKEVLVAMSGGVDSSVAAGLLQQEGYEVTGVFMCLGVGQKEGTAQEQSRSHPGCCSPQDARDAQAVAARLGIRFHVLDFRKELEEIVAYFVSEYLQARTPNPCIVCNTRLKFGKLLDYARISGIDFVATGHYAQIKEVNGQNRLFRGVDGNKDQSYALFGMARENLEKVLLPVGQYRKAQVREWAAQMDLSVHDKGESQEICFVADDDYARLIAERAPQMCRPGKVIDTSGKVLGEHEGIYKYTVGQRRGLGIALGEPAYVVRLDAQTNTVVLGKSEAVMGWRLLATQVNWLVEPPSKGKFEALVQIRYNHRGTPAVVMPKADESGNFTMARVEFAEPVKAIAPGQAAVFYDGDMVIGGGWIDSAS